VVWRGELIFEFQPKAFVDADTARQLEKKNPTLDTVVRRSALQQFAKADNHDPIFYVMIDLFHGVTRPFLHRHLRCCQAKIGASFMKNP
jgi:hypothetical protein